MKQLPRRVIKLGGSLLGWPDWPRAFERWRRMQTPAVDLIVVGGGRWVDGIRQLDRRMQLGRAAAHFLALGMMGSTARLASLLLDGLPVISQPDRHAHGPAILDIDAALDDAAYRKFCGGGVPASWATTSDSLAAYLARGVRADELVLVKSRPPPAGEDLQVWVASGYVDAFFIQALAPEQHLRTVCLSDVRRSRQGPQSSWLARVF